MAFDRLIAPLNMHQSITITVAEQAEIEIIRERVWPAALGLDRTGRGSLNFSDAGDPNGR